MDLRDLGLGVWPLGDLPQRAVPAQELLNRLKYPRSEQRESITSELAARYAPTMGTPMLTRAQVRLLRAEGGEISKRRNRGTSARSYAGRKNRRA